MITARLLLLVGKYGNEILLRHTCVKFAVFGAENSYCGASFVKGSKGQHLHPLMFDIKPAV